MEYFIFLSISVGCFVFLVQQTDFIYEYTNLLIKIFKLNFLYKLLKYNMYENSNTFENYILFLGSIYGTKSNIRGFIARLINCFICFNCFVSVFAVLFLTKNVLMIFPCFFFSILTFYVLFLIKNHVFLKQKV